jgi:type II secretory pathway pseudopilin PulG
MTRRGIAVVELLVLTFLSGVVAVVALSNFWESSVRSRVASVRSTQRQVGVALTAYHTDHGTLPKALDQLTSPVSYLRKNPADEFSGRFLRRTNPQRAALRYVTESAPGWGESLGPGIRGEQWALISRGPDMKFHWELGHALCSPDPQRFAYDPTNGTLSPGDVQQYGGRR